MLLTSDTIYNKNLPKIVMICFFAPIFFTNFWIGKTLLIDMMLGFTPERITYRNVSCGQPEWTYPITYFASVTIYFIIIISAYLLIRKAAVNSNVNLLLLGSFLFYPVAARWEFRLFHPSYLLPLNILEYKDELQEKLLPFYGNSYNMQMTTYIISTALSIFYFYLAWQVVFKHWNKTMRIQFFTYGILFTAAGRIFWYYLLGPALYNFPFREFFMR